MKKLSILLIALLLADSFVQAQLLMMKKNYLKILLIYIILLPVYSFAQIDTTQFSPLGGDSLDVNNQFTETEILLDSVTGDVHNSTTYPISITPGPGSVNVSPSTQIEIEFNNPIDPLSVDENSFFVRGEVVGPYNGTISVLPGNAGIRFVPDTIFKHGDIVRVYITTKIMNETENVRPFVFQFTVMAKPTDGIFATGIKYSTGYRPFNVFVYDLNGNGYGDIICANSSVGGPDAYNISVLMNNKDKTFAPKVNYDVGIPGECAKPHDIYVYDLDCNGYGDIAVVNECGTVSILKNNGDGTFGNPIIYNVPYKPDRIMVGDLNGNGYGDIVVSGGGVRWAGRPYFSVMLNNGDGTFEPAAQFPTGGSHNIGNFGIYLYDVDDDGDLDVVASSSGGNSISVSLNNGYGVFHPPVVYPAGIRPRDIFVSDLNGNGKGDIVVANQTNTANGTITVYKNNGDGTFSQRDDYLVKGSPVGLFISDVNGDGYGDIITANHYLGGNTISIWYNNGDGNFINRRDFNTNGSQPIGVYVADLDNDADVDIVTANWTSANISVLWNEKSGIRGTVYVDIDENCEKNLPGETGVYNRMISIRNVYTGTMSYTFTDFNGEYAAVVPAGKYVVKLIENKTTQTTCDYGEGKTYHTITFQEGGLSRENDFFIKKGCGAILEVNTVPLSISCPDILPPGVTCDHVDGPRQLCPCEHFQYQFSLLPDNSIPTYTIITINLPDNVRFCDLETPGGFSFEVEGPLYGEPTNIECPDPSCSNFVGQTFNFTKDPGPPPTGQIFSFNVQVDNVPVVNPPIELLPTAEISENCNLTFAPIPDPVGCSFDPNDKKVFPKDGPCETILPDEELVYKIRFQNIGTAPAQNVVIIDTLSNYLDIESLNIISASHTNYFVEILPGNVLRCSFPNIFLPDSITNEMGSMGYIKYTIKPKNNIDDGTQIEDKAYIYFDDNPPVITNTTVNIYNNDLPAVSIEASPLNVCDEYATIYLGYGTQSITLNSSVSGGTPPFFYNWNTGDTSENITVSPNKTTTYEFEITDMNGCTVIAEITVNVIDIRCGKNKVYICHKPPGNPSNYQTLCISENAVSAHLNNHPEDCLGQCLIKKSMILPVKTEKTFIPEVYPNPFTKSIVFLLVPPENKHIKLVIYDLSGRKIQTLYDGVMNKGEEYKIEFDGSALSAGMFFYKMITNGNVHIGKFSKK